MTTDVDAKEFNHLLPYTQEMTKMFGMDKVQMESKGMPIRTESKINLMGQVMDSTTEVQSISRESIPDTLFVVPSDYKMTEMPTIPGQQQ